MGVFRKENAAAQLFRDPQQQGKCSSLHHQSCACFAVLIRCVARPRILPARESATPPVNSGDGLLRPSSLDDRAQAAQGERCGLCANARAPRPVAPNPEARSPDLTARGPGAPYLIEMWVIRAEARTVPAHSPFQRFSPKSLSRA
jgi:hypothetical protein